MRLSSPARALLLLSLTTLRFVADAQSRQRVTVRTYRTNYRVDSWDDGRDEPYRVTFWKVGLKSVYTFDVSGHVKTLTARDTLHTFDLAPPSRMLLTSDDDPLQDVDVDLGSLISCGDCEVTFTVLCGVGLPEVCFLDDNNPASFDSDAGDSVRRFCGAFGAACEVSPADLCDDGGCIEGPSPTPEPTPATVEPTPVTVAPSPAPTPEPTPATVEPTPVSVAPSPAPTPESTPATVEPTPVTVAPSPAPTPEPTTATVEPTPVTVAPSSAPTPEPTPATVEPTPVTVAPSPAPTSESTPAPDACNPNPCENGGSCSIDPAGGHVCSCADGFGGMACQTDTSSMASFFIEIDFIGNWTDARRAVFQSAADRWSALITHVPCGGTSELPAGRLLISATLGEIDGVGTNLGSAGPTSVWRNCNAISAEGNMRFDIEDIAGLEADDTFEGAVLHYMGHVIGVGTLWGEEFAQCTMCRETGDPAWTCPAAVSTYADIGGSDADIIELDGDVGPSCGHLDEDIFDDELMTALLDIPMFLSKMTAAILDDLDYVVDPSEVDAYTLPSERGAQLIGEPRPSIVSDTVVDAVILVLDDEGDVVDEKMGVKIMF